MKWLSRLELRYGRYAVRNLTLYITILNVVAFVVSFFLSGSKNPVAASLLAFHRGYVLQGQVWRVLTFIFLPETYNPIFLFITLYFLYFIGTSLENFWGRFKFNVYYLMGAIGTIIAAFIVGFGWTGMYLNLSLFLAFATLFPDHEFLLFFILPVKAKYLAYVDIAFLLYMIMVYIRAGDWSAPAAVIAALVNYLIFFGGDIINWIKLKKQVNSNRKRFFDQVRPYDRNRKY
jgi:hypothetical protein